MSRVRTLGERLPSPRVAPEQALRRPVGVRRCELCHRFCAARLDRPDVELESVGKDRRAAIGVVRLVLRSACCGAQVGEALVDVDLALPEHGCPGGWELEVLAVVGTDRRDGRRGRRYGALVTLDLTCPCCGAAEYTAFEHERRGCHFEECPPRGRRYHYERR